MHAARTAALPRIRPRIQRRAADASATALATPRTRRGKANRLGRCCCRLYYSEEGQRRASIGIRPFVIFELTAPNLWGVSSSELVALVNAVRRQAPALVAFLMSPMQGRVTRVLDALVNAAAMEGQFDVL